MKFLLVEDEPTTALAMQTIISRYGECHLALTGQEAVQAFSLANKERQLYDLVFVDIMLPQISGLEAIKAMRATERSSNGGRATMIITSSLGEPDTIAMALSSGLADAFMVKPVTATKLAEQIEEFLRASDRAS